jgi:hypothetical protein
MAWSGWEFQFQQKINYTIQIQIPQSSKPLVQIPQNLTQNLVLNLATLFYIYYLRRGGILHL